MHMNISSISYHIDDVSSISYHIDDLTILENSCKIKPKKIGLSETRLRKNRQTLSNINLGNYYPWYSRAGTMLHVGKKLTCSLIKDPVIYKHKDIEWTFMELFNYSNLNMVIVCIYKHLKAPATEFGEDYLVPLLEKVARERKRNNFKGDFNMNILSCNSQKERHIKYHWHNELRFFLSHNKYSTANHKYF